MASLTITKNAKCLLAALKAVASLADEVVLRFPGPGDGCALRTEVVSLDGTAYAQLWLQADDVTGAVRAGPAPASCRVSLKKLQVAARDVTTLSDVLIMQHDPDRRSVWVSTRTKKAESAPVDVSAPARQDPDPAEELLDAPSDADMDCAQLDVKALEALIKGVAPGGRLELPQWPGAWFKQDTLAGVVRSTAFKRGSLLLPRGKPERPVAFSFPFMSTAGLSRLRVHVTRLQT
jgi:hypothetical protein